MEQIALHTEIVPQIDYTEHEVESLEMMLNTSVDNRLVLRGEELYIQQTQQEQYSLVDLPKTTDPLSKFYILIFWNPHTGQRETKYYNSQAAREAYIKIHLAHFLPIGAIRAFLEIIPEGFSTISCVSKEKHLPNMIIHKNEIYCYDFTPQMTGGIPIFAYFQPDERGNLEAITYPTEKERTQAIANKNNLTHLIDSQDHTAISLALERVKKEFDIENLVCVYGDYFEETNIGNHLLAIFYCKGFGYKLALVRDRSVISDYLIKDVKTEYFELEKLEEYPAGIGQYLYGNYRVPNQKNFYGMWEKRILPNEFVSFKKVEKKGREMHLVLINSGGNKEWHFCRTQKRAHQLCTLKTNGAERHEQEINATKKIWSKRSYKHYDCHALVIHDSGKCAHWLTFEPGYDEPQSKYFSLTPKNIAGLQARFKKNRIIDLDALSFLEEWKAGTEKEQLTTRVVQYENSGFAKFMCIKHDNPLEKPTVTISYPLLSDAQVK